MNETEPNLLLENGTFSAESIEGVDKDGNSVEIDSFTELTVSDETPEDDANIAVLADDDPTDNRQRIVTASAAELVTKFEGKAIDVNGKLMEGVAWGKVVTRDTPTPGTFKMVFTEVVAA